MFVRNVSFRKVKTLWGHMAGRKGVCSLCARSRTSSHFTLSIIDGLLWWGKAHCAWLAGWLVERWVRLGVWGADMWLLFFCCPPVQTGSAAGDRRSGTSCGWGGENRRRSDCRSVSTVRLLGDWLELPNALGPIERSQMCKPHPSDAWTRWKCLLRVLRLILMPSRYLVFSCRKAFFH